MTNRVGHLFQRWRQLISELLLVVSFPFFYTVAFELSKISPISQASLSELALLGIHLFCLVTLISLIFSLVLLAFSRDAAGNSWLSLHNIFIFAVSTVSFVLIIENFSYTMLGTSIKASASPAVDAAILFIAVFFALIFFKAVRAFGCFAGRNPYLTPAGTMFFLIVFLITWPLPQQFLKFRKNLASDISVIILSSDGIDADNMSIYGYTKETTPFLTSHVSEFALFENAFTNCGNTTGSITSLLTGRSPLSTGVTYPPDLLKGEDATKTLPNLLRSQGYFTSNWAVPHYADASSQNLLFAFDRNNGVSSASSLGSYLPKKGSLVDWVASTTVENLQQLTEDIIGIREMENPYSQITQNKNALSDSDRLRGLLSDIQTRDPLFSHVHFMGTHGPVFFPKQPLYSSGMEQTAPFQAEFRDDAIRDFDEQVRTVYEILKATNRLDKTLLVVTSDHAELYNVTVRIPLLIRYPGGLSSGRLQVNAQRLDLGPTILDVLGVEAASWMSGTSLRDTGHLSPDRILLSTRINSVRAQKDKTFVHDGGQSLDNATITAVSCGTFLQFLRRSGGFVKIGGGQVRNAKGTCTPPVDFEERAIATINKLSAAR